MGNLLDDQALVLYRDGDLRRRKIEECSRLIRKEAKNLRLPSNGNGRLSVGLESELKTIIDYAPAPIGSEIASRGVDNVKVEVLRCDVEIDSNPFSGSTLLTDIHKYLRQKIESVDSIVAGEGGGIILSGTVPTMGEHHLIQSPNARYLLLDYGIREARGWEKCCFSIPTIDGSVTSRRDDVWAIGYTSAYHLHIKPPAQKELPQVYNAVLGLSSLGLAPFVSSPLLQGKETIYDEVRIPIIEQAIDPRTIKERANGRPHRSDFANWCEYISSVSEYYRKICDLWSHQPFIPIPNLLDGSTSNPNLDLLIGTTWTGCRLKNNGVEWWVEDRWKPSGPTVKDDVAYTAWKLGLVLTYKHKMHNNSSLVPESLVRYNLDSVVSRGMDAVIYWSGKYKPVSSVILEVLPQVSKSLDNFGIAGYEPYLEIVEQRAMKKSSPASIIRAEYRRHAPGIGARKVVELLRQAYERDAPLI